MLMAQAQVVLSQFVVRNKKFDIVKEPGVLKAWGSIGSCIHFKVYKWLLDAAQPQLTTTTFFSSCMKLDYFVVGNFRKV